MSCSYYQSCCTSIPQYPSQRQGRQHYVQNSPYKLHKIAKSIRGSTLRWEAFQRSCKSYGIEPMTIPLDITVRWNSTFLMLLQAVYLRRAIHRYVDDLDEELSELQLSEEEWEKAEVLLVFLLPFKRCTSRF